MSNLNYNLDYSYFGKKLSVSRGIGNVFYNRGKQRQQQREI